MIRFLLPIKWMFNENFTSIYRIYRVAGQLETCRRRCCYLKNMPQIYSLEQVANNDGQNSKLMWIVVRDNVYDVTEYLNEVKTAADTTV